MWGWINATRTPFVSMNREAISAVAKLVTTATDLHVRVGVAFLTFLLFFLMLPRVVQKRLRAREFDVPPSRNVMRHQKVTLSAAVCLDIKKSITNRVVDQMVNLLLLKTPIAAKRIDVISMLIVFTVATKTDIAVSV